MSLRHHYISEWGVAGRWLARGRVVWLYGSVEFGIVIVTKALGSSRNDFDVILMRDFLHFHSVVRDWFATSFVYLGGKL